MIRSGRQDIACANIGARSRHFVWPFFLNQLPLDLRPTFSSSTSLAWFETGQAWISKIVRSWQWLAIVVLIAQVSFLTPAYADVAASMPDFYSEPGLNPFHGGTQVNAHEVIDSATGSLELSYTDLVVPGDGGMDIVIQRHYSSSNVYEARPSPNIPLDHGPRLTQFLPRNAYGLGWSMGYGRVVKAYSGNDVAGNVCATAPQGGYSARRNTLDNPILQLPDGSSQILFVNDTGFDRGNAIYITKNQWVAYCEPNSNGLTVISPDGVKYRMNFLVTGYDSPYSKRKNRSWYTTHVEDRNGNYLDIEYYDNHIGSYALIKQITSNDGRDVTFTYKDIDNPVSTRLNTIESDGRVWTYEYEPIVGSDNGAQYLLTRVLMPGGLSWKYDYYKRDYGAAGNNVLKQVTYPYGATTTYDYKYNCFARLSLTCKAEDHVFYSLSVKSKTNGGRDVTPGTWNYDYTRGTAEDVTTVTFPGGKYVYKHYPSFFLTFSPQVGCGQILWNLGLLREKLIYDGGTLTQDERYTWDDSHVISNEQYIRPPYTGEDPYDFYHPRIADCRVYVPVLKKKEVIRDGTSYTTEYRRFDADYNPTEIVETGQKTRIVERNYYPRRPRQNIVGMVQDEQLESRAVIGPGVINTLIDRTYDDNGNLTYISKYGLVTRYSYLPDGEIGTKTDGRGNVATYSDYYRGIPRTEEQPEGVTVTRTVNPSGTIASVTNGRGYTTSYEYDGLNRITKIIRPRGAETDVDWTATGRSVARGPYQQTATFDGFGRTSYTDTGGVTVDINYDALGNKSFVSYPGSSEGTTYSYDVLGRTTKVKHSDGSTRSMRYLADNREVVTDERGNTTTNIYRSYGDPDKQELVRRDSPENVTTTIERDALGKPVSISQGGFTRSYTYDKQNNFLISESNPETGATIYGRDEVGDMVSRQVGSSPVTTFTYDGRNRLVAVNYPGDTPDLKITYDADDNKKTLDNGVSQWTYDYDANDNLVSESLAVDGEPLPLSARYDYDTQDFLNTITYPSGHVVAYYPDSLGRPTVAEPYVTGVDYYPTGVPKRLQYANGVTTNITLNDRRWIENVTVSGGVADFDYSYDKRGNVTGIQDHRATTFLNGSPNDKTMSYDGLDRLVTASGPWADGHFGYDASGNLRAKTVGGQHVALIYNGTTNRLDGMTRSDTNTPLKQYSFTYDKYGNVKSNGSFIFGYDDASDLRTVMRESDAADIARFDYDGNHRRVTETKDGKKTYYFYASNGDLLGEYRAADDYKEYAYLNHKLIAQTTDTPDTSGGGSGADTDHDGLPDSWELQFFGNLNQGPNDDPDGDGLTNLQEYQQGTDPTVAAGPPSGLTLTAQGRDSSVLLSWSDDGTKSYNLYWSTSPGVTKANGHVLADVTSPYTQTGLTNGTTYYYILTSVDASGESAPSAEVSVVPSSGGMWEINWWPIISQYDIDILNAFDNYPSAAIDSKGNALVAWANNAYGAPGGVSLNGGEVFSIGHPVGGVWGANDPPPDPPLDPTYYWNRPNNSTVSDAAPSAWRPQLLYFEDGTAVCIWMETDSDVASFYMARYSPASGWGAKTEIVTMPPGLSVNSRVMEKSGDRIVLVWEMEDDNGSLGVPADIIAMQYSPASGWTTPEFIATNNADGSVFSKLVSGADDAGHIYVAWSNDGSSAGVSGSTVKVARFVPDSGWTTDSVAETPYDPQGQSLSNVRLAVAGNGMAYVLWTKEDRVTGANRVLTGSQYTTDSGWQPMGEILPPDSMYSERKSGPVYWPYDIGSDAAGNLFLEWDQLVGTDEHVNVKKYSPQDGWGDPQTVIVSSTENDYHLPEIVLGVGANGDAFVVAQKNSILELWAASYHPEAGWKTEVLGSAETGDNLEVHSPQLAVAPNGSAVLVWKQDYSVLGAYYAVSDQPANTPPVANAGPDHIGKADTVVTLDGRGSSDADGAIVSYKWEQTAGQTVTLNNSDKAVATFNMPSVAVGAQFVFKLTVTDDKGATGVDTVVITSSAANIPPTVDAGADQRVNGDRQVTLAGSASDPDGRIVSYHWEQISGPAVSLYSPDSPVTQFMAPSPNGRVSLTFRLTVTDDNGATASDTTMVTVYRARPTDTTPPRTRLTVHYNEQGAGLVFTVNEPAQTYFRVVSGTAFWFAGGSPYLQNVWFPVPPPEVAIPEFHGGVLNLHFDDAVRVEYFSVDLAGNTESVQTAWLQWPPSWKWALRYPSPHVGVQPRPGRPLIPPIHNVPIITWPPSMLARGVGQSSTKSVPFFIRAQ